MLSILIFGLATLSFLIALYTIEQRPGLSRVSFGIASLGYVVTPVLGLHFLATNVRYLLALSLWWHLFNCYAGLRRFYARPFLQHRLLHSWLVLCNINLTLYVLCLFDTTNWRPVTDGLLLAASVYVLVRILWQLRQTKPHRPATPLKDLPTVSLLIPARNEDRILTEALHIALAVDYPKLEIIVLDDCSQDRTPEIIRDFAHDGVRFIQTEALPEDWLGKNYALARLAEEASGDIFVFCDVDVRLAPTSISQLIKQLDYDKLDMISVVPQRQDFDTWANLFAPLLPWWQLLVPKSLTGTESLSATPYVIRRAAYEAAGGHAAWRTSIVPEYHFAHALAEKHGYKQILGDTRLGITTRKRLSSQGDNQIRYYYPLLGGSPGIVLLAATLISFLFVYPVWLSFHQPTPVHILPWCLLGLSFLLYGRRTQPVSWWLMVAAMPLVVLHELLLIVYSMLKYEVGKVIWKERNVCYPKLLVTPHLPPLPD